MPGSFTIAPFRSLPTSVKSYWLPCMDHPFVFFILEEEYAPLVEPANQIISTDAMIILDDKIYKKRFYAAGLNTMRMRPFLDGQE